MSVSPVRRFRLPLALSSWLTFAIAFTFYVITLDPGASYWDCPEYITVASRLEVGHPPGNPLWMLAMRAATIPFPPHFHAYVINLCSALFMAFAAFFLCRLIFIPTRLYIQKLYVHKNLTQGYSDVLAVLIASGASLCYALCDSAWFSAIEAEVYAMSAFLSSLSLWIMMDWWYEDSKSRRSRLIVLLAYITGLSLGVHQLNLLLIPVFLVDILYKEHSRKVNPASVLLAVTGSIAIIGFVLLAFIPGILFGAESFELFSVNSFGFPYNSGVLIFLFLLFILIVISLLFLYHPLSPLTRKNLLHPNPHPSTLYLSTPLWFFSFLLLGLSSFGVIMLRAQAAPFMNEGDPDNIFALNSYILREQYPKTPLFFGETPYSRPTFQESFNNGMPVYSKYKLKKEKGIYQPFLPGAALNHRSGMLSHNDSTENQMVIDNRKGYILSDYKFSQVLTPELNMWFPRMTSRNVGDREAYVGWGGMEEDKMVKIPISETMDAYGSYKPRMDGLGNRVPVYSYRPSLSQNMTFFVSYQTYFMYFRYLFWNFIGRQNDFHTNGEIEHGNFITGFPHVDRLLIGETEHMPPEIWKDNKGRNRYYGIPFAFGLLGFFWLLFGNRRKRRIFTLIFVLFLMTGLAIVVYLNQSPGEPRERDYSFLCSYMAFVMWIAAGLTAISSLLIKSKLKNLIIPLTAILSLGIPSLMAAQNFDDHDRRFRYEPTFYASSLLDFEMPAVIFSHGDNSSFPLWYASEVLGMGKDHTPVDITYISLPSYIVNLKKQGEKGLKTIAGSPDIAFGKFLLTRIPHDSVSEPLPLDLALKNLYESPNASPEWSSSKVIVTDGSGKESIINLHDFSKGSSFLSFKHLMLLDILAAQSDKTQPQKILFFPYLIDHSFYKPLDSLLQPALFGNIYAPALSDAEVTDLLKKSVERELEKLNELNIKPHYVDPVIADRSVRYRGELIIAANQLLNSGDTLLPVRLVESIEKFYPYAETLPGTFTISDSTYYEGKEYLKLLSRLHSLTGNPRYTEKAQALDSLMSQRHRQWLAYYHSLTPSQRKTLSNRSRRLLLP